MQLADFYAQIKRLKQPIFETRDVVALLDLSTTTASKALARLSQHHHLVRLCNGLWALPDKVQPWALPEYLTAPFPSYISLQSALYHYGMIEQIPQITYAVSIARTKRFITPLATVSIHHVAPQFYFGYTVDTKNNIKIATPEKALLDFLYLSPAKSHKFATLPEFELPEKFNRNLCYEWLDKIPSVSRRTLIRKKLELYL
jgi:predicted transcriptional regulator of viral defense system